MTPADLKSLAEFPVYEFRPHPDWSGPFLRYAEGAWIADDGEHDLAFAAPDNFMAYGVDLPYYENIRRSGAIRGEGTGIRTRWLDARPAATSHPRWDVRTVAARSSTFTTLR